MSYSAISAFNREPLDTSYWFQEGPGVRNWQFTTSGIKLLNVGNITTTGNLNLAKTSIHLSHDEVSRSYEHFLLDAGDLVIASSGISFDTDGLLRTKMAFVSHKELPLCLNTSTIRFKSKDAERASIQFLRFWFDSQDFRLQITRLVTGSAQQNFGPSHLKQLTIPLPSLPEQKRIAAILDKADRLRRQRRFAQTLSDSFLQSVFIKMFGDPVSNSMKWERAGLKDLGYVQTGNTPPREVLDNYGDFIEWIKSDDIIPSEMFIRKSKERLSREGAKLARQVGPGSVLVTCIAGSENSIGNAALTDRVVAFNQQINAISARKGVEPLFLFGLLVVCKSLVQRNTTLGMKRIITKSKFESLQVIKPPLSLQERFTEIIQKFERIRRQQREATRQAEHLFQTLLHRAFRGEL